MVLQVERERIGAPKALLERIVDTIELDDAPVAVPDPAPGPLPDELACWLDATLQHELGLASVARDADGDLPVPFGGTVVYVRQGAPDAKFLTVVALLLEEFELTTEMYEAVNTINVQIPLAKTVVDVAHNQIVTSVELPVVDTLSPQDLLLAIETVADTAGYFDTMLQAMFGGATTLDA